MNKPETKPLRESGTNRRAVVQHRARGRTALLGALAVAAALPLVAFSCTNAPSNEFPAAASGSTGEPSGSGSGGQDGGVFFDSGFDLPLQVSPEMPVLKLDLPVADQKIQFTCASSGSPVDATWSLSSLELGTIDAMTGLFTPNGKRRGEVIVTCAQKDSDAKAQTKLKVVIHAIDNVGGVTPEQIKILRGPPGSSDEAWKFLYPYDKTIFPRGIPAPEIHLTQGTTSGKAFYVSIAGTDIEYEGFFNASGTDTQLQMSQEAWEALSSSLAGSTIEVRVSKLHDKQKYGPIYRRWTIADGKLHGTIYYNTYDSPLAGKDGAMMRIKGSSPTAEVLIGKCTVCHSIGADGSTAAAANHDGMAGTFDLTGGNVDPPILWQEANKAAFAGIFPKNGEVIVIHGSPNWAYTPGVNGTYKSELRTKNGTIIPNSGIEAYYAQSPAFSHDGTMLAFTDRSAGSTQTSLLALMHYDAIAQKFSNYDVLATPAAGRHLSWPAFTPDGKFLVYQDGVGNDLVTWNGNTGRIFAIDLQTKQITYLTNLNGDGYMPQGARDENKNYEPTLAPIASGGYFWLMFTSRRTYGNKLMGTEAETKRLWVSALSIDPQGGLDFSHPAFYISGQELTSGNSRGFWALDPCKADGAGCESGDECCKGYCNPTGDPPTFKCGPPDGTCSDEYETCETSADCCDTELQCINNKCTMDTPQ